MGLKIEIRYLEKVNWSLLNSGIPLVARLAVTNTSGDPCYIKLKLKIDRYCEYDTWSGEIPPRENREIRLSKLRADYVRAVDITYVQRERNLIVSVDHHSVHQHVRFPVQLLTANEWMAGLRNAQNGRVTLDSTLGWVEGYWEVGADRPQFHNDPKEWTGDPPLQSAVASFVLPEDPWVETNRVSWRPCPPAAMEAVYDVLSAQKGTVTADIEKYSLERHSQRIRVPAEIFAANADNRKPVSCIDWALLAAGLLESCGQKPLVAIVKPRHRDVHALVGYWNLADRRMPMITNGVLIKQLLEEGKLAFVDALAALNGTTFQEAKDQASSQIRRDFVYAIDIDWVRGLADIDLTCRVVPLPFAKKTLRSNDPPPPPALFPDEAVQFIRLESPSDIPSSEGKPAPASEVVKTWLHDGVTQPLALVCSFPNDVRETLEALARAEADDWLFDLVWPNGPMRAEGLPNKLEEFNRSLKAQNPAPTVFLVDLSPLDITVGAYDWRLLIRSVGDVWDTLRNLGHGLVLGLPKWLADEARGWADDLHPLIYESSRLFSDEYHARVIDCEKHLHNNVRLGSLSGLLACNSLALAREVVAELRTARGGYELDPASENPTVIRSMLALAARLTRKGFYEIAFRIEIACIAARCTKNDVSLDADIVPNSGDSMIGYIVEYIDDIGWTPNTVPFGRLIGADPGSGKTSALHRIERLWATPPATIVRQSGRCYLPVFVASEGQTDLLAALKSTFRHRHSLVIDNLSLNLECHRFLAERSADIRKFFVSPIYFLVDGLDGLNAKSNEFVANLGRMNLPPDYGLLIASSAGEPQQRSNFVPKSVRLRRLDAARIREFVDRRDPGFSARLGAEVGTILRSLPANPQVLAYLCENARAAAALSTGLADIVSEYVKRQMKDLFGDADNLSYLLGQSAYQILNDPASPWLLISQAADLIEAGRRANLLRWRPEAHGLAFVNEYTCGYFAARHLLDNPDKYDELVVVLSKANEVRRKRWRTCFAILTGLARGRRSTEILGVLRGLDPVWAAHCLSTLSDPMQTELRSERHELACAVADPSIALHARRAIAEALGAADSRIETSNPERSLIKLSAPDRVDLWIGRYPVTYLEYAQFIRDGGYTTFEFWPGEAGNWLKRTHFSAPAFWEQFAGNRPNYAVTGVSFHEAMAYCRWLGKTFSDFIYFLPSAAEWNFAAFGTVPATWVRETRLWYLRKAVASGAADELPGDLSLPAHELELRIAPMKERIENQRLSLTRREPMPIGVFLPNEYGIFDLFGGAWEWCATEAYDMSPDERSDSRSRHANPMIVKGGSVGAEFDIVKVIVGGSFDAGTRYENLGFRVFARRGGIDIVRN